MSNPAFPSYKHEMFAAMAMYVFCSYHGRFDVAQMAIDSVRCADALLAELAKPQEVAK